MFTGYRDQQNRRRGVVLILILGMLALLALIGVTFASFSGQAQIGARNYALGYNAPGSEQVMDFALDQLITGTNNPLSAIRGHELARDMYGNDSGGTYSIGYLGGRPDNGLPMTITQALAITQNTSPASNAAVTIIAPAAKLATNIAANDPAFYGYSFARWVVRGSYATNPPVPQTFEILYDDNSGSDSNYPGVRVFFVTPIDTNTVLWNQGNPSLSTNLPNFSPLAPGITTNGVGGFPMPFTLDGRSLRAFNGPGMVGLNHIDNFGGGQNTDLNGSAPLFISAAMYGNFRVNGNILTAFNFNLNTSGDSSTPAIGDPTAIGMDEDYDAPDLENWFLAVQSADGQVVLPSFHRPGILSALDWTNNYATSTPLQATLSQAKILCPRKIDHPTSTITNPVPGPSGKITYDVDNDGDGHTDSVWLDLGYPVQRDAQGRSYKPLFSFLVIGLNGRIPLNTAGNIQARDFGGDPIWDHTSHLGYSVNEINPKYVLQNAYSPNGAYYPVGGGAALGGGIPIFPTDMNGNPVPNSQYDSSVNFGNPPSGVPNNSNNPLMNTWNGYGNFGLPITIATTQLRNILTGTRPQLNPYLDLTLLNPALVTNQDSNYVMVKGQKFFVPNNISDLGDTVMPNSSGLIRNTPPVTGRWGEHGGIPAVLPLPDATPATPQTLPGYLYFNNFVRAGHSPSSLGWGELNTGSYNPSGAYQQSGSDDDFDTYDPFPAISPEIGNPNTNPVTPPDFYDATGAVLLPVERMRRWVTPIDPSGNGLMVDYNNPPNTQLDYGYGSDRYGRVSYFQYFRPPGMPGPITYPNTTSANWFNEPIIQWPVNQPPAPIDLTNNLYHGYDAARNPGGTNSAMMAAMPGNVTLPSPNWPQVYTFDGNVNWDSPVPLVYPFGTANGQFGNSATPGQTVINGYILGSLNRDEADEMNLYHPGQYDDPFGSEDLEWLYRAQDFDGRSIYSRLSQLAPVSFVAASDSLKRRRMVSIDTWDTNTYAWGPPNPVSPTQGGQNFRYTNTYAGYNNTVATALNGGIEALIANNAIISGNGSVFMFGAPSLAHRNKKINLNYPLPVSNDPFEPVRQKWILEAYNLLKETLPYTSVDSSYEKAALSQFLVNVIDFRDSDSTVTVFQNPDLIILPATGSTPTQLAVPAAGGAGTSLPLVQYGMEFPPIALSEVLAFQFNTKSGGNNTPVQRIFIEVENLLTRSAATGAGGAANPSDLNLAGWDFVISQDNPATLQTRPNSITGQIYLPNLQGSNPVPSPVPVDVTAGNGLTIPVPAMQAAAGAAAINGQNYHYVFGNTNNINGAETGDPNTLNVVDQALPLLSSQLPPPNTVAVGSTQFLWLYLRRPVNPFDPTNAALQTNNPFQGTNYQTYYDGKVVVDAFRFAFTESGFQGTSVPQDGPMQPNGNLKNWIYSLQRMQPLRGGHAVAPPTTAPPVIPPYAYGYSEQTDPAQTIGQPTAYTLKYGNYQITQVYNTLGLRNDTRDPVRDFLPFHDRDFTSVAELTLVPGCPPGLFTKQFVEDPPPLPTPNFPAGYPAKPLGGLSFPTYPAAGTPFTVTSPRTYPYLVDNFFYTAVSDENLTAANNNTNVYNTGGWSSAGWHQMFENFEVPSTANGAIGPVALGSNFDWMRQDLKPGLMNLNLIMDQEVFFGLFDDPRMNYGLYSLLNVNNINAPLPSVVTQMSTYGYPTSTYLFSNNPFFFDTGDGLYPVVGLTGAFSDFLKLRSGGTNYLFGHGVGGTGAAIPGNNAQLTYNPQIASDRWFHDFSYPDINYTVMRPAALPPTTFLGGSVAPGTAFAYPQSNVPINAATIAITPAPAGRAWQFNSGLNAAPVWQADPGWKNPYLTWTLTDPGLYNPTLGYPYINASVANMAPAAPQPPPIPPRRLFQIPDTSLNAPMGTNPQTYYSNAVESIPLGSTGNQAVTINQQVQDPFLSNPNYDLITLTNPAGAIQPYFLGNNSIGSNTGGGGGRPRSDQRTHPAYRIEMMEKVMNLTTVRTHQYAVWITVGFFEVVKPGNAKNFNANGQLLPIPDQIGPELDLYAGKNVRYRSFFVVDRTKISGFNDPNFPLDFHDAVTYRRRIE